MVPHKVNCFSTKVLDPDLFFDRSILITCFSFIQGYDLLCDKEILPLRNLPA